MTTLTVQEYGLQQAACNNLCEVQVSKTQEDAMTLPCVRCPFCKEIVTALLTPATISCPACKVTVNR